MNFPPLKEYPMYVAIKVDAKPTGSIVEQYEHYEVGFYDPSGNFQKLGKYTKTGAMDWVCKLNGTLSLKTAVVGTEELTLHSAPAGISTRDYFAGQALRSIMEVERATLLHQTSTTVARAYEWADLMLKSSTEAPGSMYDELLAVFAPYAEAAPAPLSALKAVVAHMEGLFKSSNDEHILTDDPIALEDCISEAKQTLKKLTDLFLKMGKPEFNA